MQPFDMDGGQAPVSEASERISPKIQSLDSLCGVEVIDRIESARSVLLTDDSPTPERTLKAQHASDEAADLFCFPVTSVAELDATTLKTTIQKDLFVRDPETEIVAATSEDAPSAVSEGEWTVELVGYPIKLYLAIEGSLLISREETHSRIVADSDATVLLGARSHHRLPARTLTVPESPAGVRAAISVFGDTLKTTSPERSFPTLRGHPPMIQWQRDTDATAAGELPTPSRSSNIQLFVPDTFEAAAVVAPLAYYLGATVAEGPPMLQVGSVTYPLGQPPTSGGAGGSLETPGPQPFQAPTLEQTVDRLLKHCFTLDCIVRTEGYYEVPLQARRQLEEQLALETQALYEASLVDRTQAYLSYPHGPVSEVAPRWHQTAFLPPGATGIPSLPFLAARLSTVNIYDPTADLGASAGAPLNGPVSGGRRGDRSGSRGQQATGSRSRRGRADATTASTTGSRPETQAGSAPQVSLPETASQQQLWIGDEVAPWATATLPRDLMARVERSPDDLPQQISVSVVCTDPEMVSETAVREEYGGRDMLQFQVDVYENATCETVREVLEGETTLVHYIGHATPAGLHCRDGVLDPSTIGSVGPDVAVLNGCESAVPGRRLVDNGLVAALVTASEVPDHRAVSVGQTASRLLNQGWSLSGALSLLDRLHLEDAEYCICGAGSSRLAQHDDGVPALLQVFRDEAELLAQTPAALRPADPPDVPPDKLGVAVETMSNPAFELGSLYNSYLHDSGIRRLAGGPSGTLVLSPEEFIDELEGAAHPVFIDRQLSWADELELGEPPLDSL